MIDEAALDRAVRRFHPLLEAARKEPDRLRWWRQEFWQAVSDAHPAIVAEYRRIVAKE